MRVTHPFFDKIRRTRILGLSCLLVFLLIAAVGEASDDRYLVYVGTYTGKGSEGIYAYRFDPATGESSPTVLAAATDNPSFLAVDPKGRFLYAVSELDMYRNEPTGAVSVFAIDRESGKLSLLQQVPSLGTAPAHLSLDKSARFLLVANYNSGNYAVFPIGPDGRLGQASALVQDRGSSVNPERQAGPHAHSIQVTPDNRIVLVADLGLDELLVYRLDTATGALTPGSPKSVKVDPGAGPRHVAFAPSGKFVYLVCEMGSTVTAFTWDPDRGALEVRQTLSTLPKSFVGPNRAAEIAIDQRGRFLYVSNRGDDSVMVYGIDPGNGELTALQRISSGGQTPRHFTIDPTGKWLFVANHNSNDIRLFEIDLASGRLTPTDRSLTVADPVCVLFVPRQ